MAQPSLLDVPGAAGAPANAKSTGRGSKTRGARGGARRPGRPVPARTVARTTGSGANGAATDTPSARRGGRLARLARAARSVVGGLSRMVVGVRDALDDFADWMVEGTPALAAGASLGATEPLEGRTLLSAVTLQGGVLNVVGNPTGANTLIVQWSSDHQRLNIAANNVLSVHKFATVSQIQVFGGAGNDGIYVSPDLPATVKVSIATGGGRDSIVAPRGAAINGAAPVPTPAPTNTGTPAPVVTPSVAAPPPVVVPALGTARANVVGNTGWVPPTGAGNMAGNPGVTTVRGYNPDPSAPQPVIDVLTQTVYARTSVQFNGIQSSLGAGDPLSSFYQWNFGDPAGEHNTLTGWNAGHVYDRPGVYAATLSVTNQNGKTTSASVRINVVADNRRTVFVDANAGNDANSGDAGRPIRTIARAQQLIGGGNVRILLHGGEVFGVTQPTGLAVTAPNVYIGAYGGGTPLVKLLGPSDAVQSFRGATNLVVEGIAFDSVYAPVGGNAPHINASGIFPGGTNTLVRNCAFYNIDYAVNTEVQPTGVMLLDNTAPSTTGLRGYIFWGQGTDDVIIGNYDAASTREHDLRTEGVDRILVAYNNFTTHDGKGTVEIHKGSYAYVIGNTLTGGPLRAGPRGGGTEPSNTATVWTVFDGNRVLQSPINILPGTYHFAIRNNIIDDEGLMDINVSPVDNEGRGISDVRIFNNTGIDQNNIGQFLYSIGGLPSGSILMGNNLFVAPHLTPGVGGSAPVNVRMYDLSGFRGIFNNVWANDAGRGSKWSHGGINFIWPNFTNSAGYLTAAQWAAKPQVRGDVFSDVPLAGNLAATGAASRAALPLAGVFTDFYGRLRPAGAGWSVGAVQG